MINLIKNALNQKKYEEAYEIYKGNPQLSTLNSQLSTWYLSILRHTLRFEELRQHIENNIPPGDRLKELAKYYEAVGNYDQASKFFLSYIKSSKFREDDFLRAINAFLRAKNFDLANKLTEENKENLGKKYLILKKKISFLSSSTVYSTCHISTENSHRDHAIDIDESLRHTFLEPSYLASQISYFDKYIDGFKRYKHGIILDMPSICRDENVFVISNPGVVINSEGRPASAFTLSNPSYMRGKYKTSRSRFLYIDSNVFFVNRLGDSNYYHWLTELLPQYLRCPVGYKPLIFNPSSIQIDSLNFLADIGIIENNFITVLTDGPSTIFAPSVAYTNFPPYHHLTSATVNLVTAIKEKIIIKKNIRNNFGKKLYATRNGSRVKNEDLLIAFLSNRGFDIIDNGELTFQEQCEAYMNADIVIGVHGANLANCIFMNSASSVIELMSTKLMNRVFAINSSVFGLNHYIIFNDGESWDFVIDNGVIENIDNFLVKINI